MGVLSSLFGLPLAPVRGVVAIAKVLKEQAEQELYDPKVVQRQLEEIEERRAAGEITVEQEQAEQQEVLDRLMRGPEG